MKRHIACGKFLRKIDWVWRVDESIPACVCVAGVVGHRRDTEGFQQDLRRTASTDREE